LSKIKSRHVNAQVNKIIQVKLMSKIKSRHVNTQVNKIIQVKLMSKIKSRHVNTQVNKIIQLNLVKNKIKACECTSKPVYSHALILFLTYVLLAGSSPTLTTINFGLRFPSAT
jgi:hypothetical protein